MRGIVLLVLAVVSAGFLGAQSITIVDASSKQGISQVAVSSSTASGSTDKDGQIDLSIFNSTDTLLIQHLSYYAQFVLFTSAVAQKTIFLQGKAYAIDPVVISANKWEQHEERISDQITLLSPKDISLQNPGTAADLLGSSGEVFIQKSQLGGGSPMIRGFSANRVLIVVDGVRMNNAIYRSGNLQNVISIDPNILRVAEVIHGPGAMTYGSDAIGGVMDFHTYDPELKTDTTSTIRGSALARYAAATEEQAYHAHINAGWNVFALLGSFSHTEYGDPSMGSNGPDEYLRAWYVDPINGIDSIVENNDPEKQIGNAFHMDHMLAKLRYRPNNNWNLVFGAYHSETGNIPRYDRLIQTRDDLPRYAEWEYGPQSWSMYSVKVDNMRDSGVWSNARFVAAFQQYEESRIDRNFRSDERRIRNEEVQGFWLNLDFEKDLSKRTELFYGFESVNNQVRSAARSVYLSGAESMIINPRYPDGSDWSTRSAYASTTHEISKTLVFNGGLRINNTVLNAEFDTSLFAYPETNTSLSSMGVTGSAGLIWQLDSTRRVSFDVSRGFRAPNIDDIGKVFDSEPGTVIIPNTELAPEYVTSFELGLERKVKDDLRISLNAYYSLLDDAIVRRPFALNGADSIMYDGELSQVQALQNAANAYVYGFHVGFHWKFHQNWSTDVHYNWQEGEEDDDELEKVPSRHVPPAFANLKLSWEKRGIRVMCYADFSEGFDYEQLAPTEQNKPHIYAIDSNGLPYSPEWYTINVKGDFDVNDSFNISVGVENITDKRYRTYSSGVVAPGRNLLLALRATF